MKFGAAKTKARVVRASLTAVFRASLPPSVWQFDLEKNANFSLIQQDEGEGAALAVVTPVRENPVIVARFATREDAQEAWERVQKALISRKESRRGKKSVWGWILLILVILFIGGSFLKASNQAKMVGLATMGVPAGPTLPVPGYAPPAGLPKLGAAPRPVELQNGVPASADDVLKMPEEK